MASAAAEAKAAGIVNAFMEESFEEEADAAAWLAKRIATALDEAALAGAKAGKEVGMLSLRRDR